MRHAKGKSLAALVLLATLAGCGRQAPLNLERDIELEALGGNNIHPIDVSPPAREQKVSVLVRTNNVPINIYIVLAKDASTLNRELEAQKELSVKPLVQKEGLQEGSLEATIPAASGFSVVLTNTSSKTASVAVKITGK